MIQLDENYRITFDSHNVIIEERKDIKAGTFNGKKYPASVKWLEKYYYSTMKKALKGWLNENLKRSENLEDMVVRINRVENKIDHLLTLREKNE